MIYNADLPFTQQEADVKEFVYNKIAEESPQPYKYDYLQRPKCYRLEITDDSGQSYIVEIENEFISDASWALKKQIIKVK